jgi:hypothetical protein
VTFMSATLHSPLHIVGLLLLSRPEPGGSTYAL